MWSLHDSEVIIDTEEEHPLAAAILHNTLILFNELREQQREIPSSISAGNSITNEIMKKW
jgi:hypothetical protein